MTSRELDLLLAHFDTMSQKIDASNADIKQLDKFIREHMEKEELSMHLFDKRLSKLEWKANGLATFFGLIGGLLSAKLYAIFGIDKS